MSCLKPSLEQGGNLGPDAARARNRRSLSTARCAGRGGVGKTLESSVSKVPALHREAERDTTGSFSRQPPVHTWIGGWVQEKRRRIATLRLIRRYVFKLELTLWFYCGKRAARRHGFGGEPRKSSCFAGRCPVVRRSIAVFRGYDCRCSRWSTTRLGRRLEFSHRFRRSPRRRRQANPVRSRPRQDHP